MSLLNKLRDPLYQTPLSERWHRVAIMQAAGIARSWRTNRATAYQQYQADLEQYQRKRTAGTLPAKAKEPQWQEWNIPTLREPCIQANVNVVRLEPSHDSTYAYWLTISTLEKRQPIQVPVKLAPVFGSARPTHSLENDQCKKLTIYGKRSVLALSKLTGMKRL